SIAVEGLLRFDHVTAAGLINLPNARVAGDLAFFQSSIEVAGGMALHAPGLEGMGNLAFEATTIRGRINLIGASFAGDFGMMGGSIDAPNISIHADGLKVSGRCFIRDGMKIKGTVRLIGAKIGGEFDAGSIEITGVEEVALDARTARIGGACYLSNGFRATGKLTFY